MVVGADEFGLLLLVGGGAERGMHAFLEKGYFYFEVDDDTLLIERASAWGEVYLRRGVMFMQLLDRLNL